jgi:hypothetical protein
MEDDGVNEFVRERGGEKMRRPSLSNLPAGEASLLRSTAWKACRAGLALDCDAAAAAAEVALDADAAPSFAGRSRFLLALTRALAAVWSCCATSKEDCGVSLAELLRCDAR